MGNKSPQIPAAPDPAVTSAAQAAANQGTARVSAALNRVNTVSPMMSTTWDKGGTQGYTDPSTYPQRPAPTPPVAGAPPPSGATSGSSSSSSSAGTWQDATGQWHNADGSQYTGQPIDGSGNPGGSSPAGGTTTPGNDSDNPDVSGDIWSQTTTLSPEQQALYEQQVQLQSGAQGAALGQLPKIQGALNQTTTYNGLPANVTGVDYGSLQSVDPNFARGGIQSSLDFSSLPQLNPGTGIQTSVDPAQGQIQTALANVGGPQRSVGITDPAAFTQNVANTIYGASTALTSPQQAQGREELRQQLADQGIPEDSASGLRQLQNYDNSVNIANQQAASGAVTTAGNQAATLFGLDLSKFGAENSAQNQAFTEGLQSGEFGNNAQQLSFGENLSSMDAANAAQNQGFNQNLSAAQQIANQITQQGTFANQAQQQDYSQSMAGQQLALQLRSQGLSEQEVNAQLASAARAAGYTEANNVRLQPITDAAMLAGATGG